MKKREKFLLSFCIAVIFLLILYYVSAVSGHNMIAENPNQFSSGEVFEDGTEYIKGYFKDIYGVDIITNPEFIFADSYFCASETLTDTLFSFICAVITVTTVLYLIMDIKIESFKEYWKDLFKGLLIIIIVSLLTSIFQIIHYDILVKTTYYRIMEYSIFAVVFEIIMAWGTMIVGNIILNMKKLRITKKSSIK